MSIGPFEFERSGRNQSAVHTGETLVDEISSETIPRLLRQSERTLDALGEARQRDAERQATRGDLRAELRSRRERGLR